MTSPENTITQIMADTDVLLRHPETVNSYIRQAAVPQLNGLHIDVSQNVPAPSGAVSLELLDAWFEEVDANSGSNLHLLRPYMSVHEAVEKPYTEEVTQLLARLSGVSTIAALDWRMHWDSPAALQAPFNEVYQISRTRILRLGEAALTDSLIKNDYHLSFIDDGGDRQFDFSIDGDQATMHVREQYLDFLAAAPHREVTAGDLELVVQRLESISTA